MFDPKWGVFAAALGAFALAASYDLRLGVAAGVVIAIMAAIYLWVRLRFAFGNEDSPANRSKLATRFARLDKNRRDAQAREGTRKDRTEPS